eukprot:augustus_masked-scaffold_51-processed-gene-0.34-mRNA-1 protein AED:1.00 eAED:1.00 QI:0/-1/0/0/-1/1/1/0/698
MDICNEQLLFDGELVTDDEVPQPPLEFYNETVENDNFGGNSSDEEEKEVESGSESWNRWKGLLGLTWLKTYAKYVKERHRVYKLVQRNQILLEWEEDQKKTSEDIKKQGDISLYDNSALKQRNRNKYAPAFKAAVDQLWNIEDFRINRLKHSDPPGIDKKTYFGFNIRCQRVIVPLEDSAKKDLSLSAEEVNKQRENEELRIAQEDWSSDINLPENQHKTLLTYEGFFESMFEIADVWSQTLEVDEYVKVLNLILEGIVEQDKRRITEQRRNADTRARVSQIIGALKKTNRVKFNEFFKRTDKDKIRRLSQINFNTKLQTVLDKIPKLQKNVALQHIAKLYEDYLGQRNRPIGFDKFVLNSYMRKFGSSKQAKKHIKRLIRTAFEYQEEPKFRLFLKLAGLYVDPLSNTLKFPELVTFDYDANIAGSYIFPLLLSCAKKVGSSELNLAEIFVTEKSTLVLKMTFIANFRRLAKYIPPNSFRYLEYMEFLDSISQSLQKPKPKVSDIAHIVKKQTANPFKKLIAASRLSNRVSLAVFQSKKIVDLHQALLLMFDLFLINQKWKTVVEFILASKFAMKFSKFSRENSERYQNIRRLSEVQIAHGKVNCQNFANVARLSVSIAIVEQITGEIFQKILALKITPKEGERSEEDPKEIEEETDTTAKKSTLYALSKQVFRTMKVLRSFRKPKKIDPNNLHATS